MLTDEKISELWMSLEPGAAGNANVFARAIDAAVREEMAQGQEPVAWLDLTRFSRAAMTYASSFKVSYRQTPLYAAPVIPDGMVMVPREPSDQMIHAAKRNGAEGSDEEIASDYRAMIVAAEKQNARS